MLNCGFVASFVNNMRKQIFPTFLTLEVNLDKITVVRAVSHKL